MTSIPDAGEGKGLNRLALIVANGMDGLGRDEVGFTWGEFSADEKAVARSIVRAVLTALRTPDAGMVEAMVNSDTGDASKTLREVYAAEFTAAIDHLIKEGAGE